jgi:quercetin dioxygenase-like cupin family protein
MTHVIVAKDERPHSGSAYTFEGYRHGGANVSFFLSDTPLGGGPCLHTHPYDEVFVVQESELTFTVWDTTVKAEGRQILVAPAGAPHKFVNSGTSRARHIDIHTSRRMTTEWLEGPKSDDGNEVRVREARIATQQLRLERGTEAVRQ